MRSLSSTIDARGVSSCRLQNHAQRLVHDLAKLLAANKGSILVASNARAREAKATKEVEEVEAEINWRSLVSTWEDPKVPRGSLHDDERSSESSARHCIPESKIKMK